MANAIKSLVLSSLLLCLVPSLVLAQSAPAPAAAVIIADEQAKEMITHAISLKASGDPQQAAKLLIQVAKSDSKHFGEAAYLLGMQAFEMKKYDLAEKTFKRSVQGNYGPAKAKLLETQTIMSAASAQSANSNQAGILEQVLAYEAKIEVARDQFTASSDVLKNIAANDYKAKADTKRRLRTELEATIKLHNDQLELIPAGTTNSEMLKIRNSTTLFKDAYEKFYQSIRPYKIAQDTFMYELSVSSAKALVIRRRMNAATKSGDSTAWLADQAKIKAEFTEQIAICSNWLAYLDKFQDPDWTRERLNIELIADTIRSEIRFADMGMKFWNADRDN